MKQVNKYFCHIRRGRNGRKPSNYPYDSAGVPLRITNFTPNLISNPSIESIKKESKESNVVCLQEMMSLLDCLGQHEFDKNLCKQQSAKLQQCYQNFMTRREDHKKSLRALKK